MASSSECRPPPPSFSSLPYDVVLNVLARISRSYHPTLSLVSKSFRSLLVSPELDVTRTLIGKTENCLYLCLDIPKNRKYKPNPRWFTLTSTPKQKLLPMPTFPYKEHPETPTVISIGSKIYMIGGLVNEKRSRSVFLFDSRSRQWSKLPKMRIPRRNSAAGLMDGKIYVFGGCRCYNDENWGEIYDPRSQTWEPLSPTTLTPDLSIQKTAKIYVRKILEKWTIPFTTNLCFVGKEKILCRSRRLFGKGLQWFDLEEDLGWRDVKGLEELSPIFISVANPEGGRRLTAWWTLSVSKEEEEVTKTEIWCSEISFERRSREELCGIVEWSKMLYTFHSWKSDGIVSLSSSAIVTC